MRMCMILHSSLIRLLCNMISSIKKISSIKELSSETRKLSVLAFPANELLSFEDMFVSFHKYLNILEFYDESTFVGYVAYIAKDGIVNITYLAISPELRDKGYGSYILKYICDNHKSEAIGVDIEQVEEGKEKEIRIKRRNFYLRNGFKSANIVYFWQGTNYEFLYMNEKPTTDDLMNFWKSFYF